MSRVKKRVEVMYEPKVIQGKFVMNLAETERKLNSVQEYVEVVS